MVRACGVGGCRETAPAWRAGREPGREPARQRARAEPAQSPRACPERTSASTAQARAAHSPPARSAPSSSLHRWRLLSQRSRPSAARRAPLAHSVPRKKQHTPFQQSPFVNAAVPRRRRPPTPNPSPPPSDLTTRLRLHLPSHPNHTPNPPPPRLRQPQPPYYTHHKSLIMREVISLNGTSRLPMPGRYRRRRYPAVSDYPLPSNPNFEFSPREHQLHHPQPPPPPPPPPPPAPRRAFVIAAILARDGRGVCSSR